MLKDITLGQYFPGDSVVHKLDPRTKLLLTLLYIVLLFVARESALPYVLLALCLVAAVAASRLHPKTIFRGLRPLVLVVLLTAILNMFFTPGTPIFTLGVLHPTWEGLRHAIFMLVRIVLLVCGTFLLTYTTSPIALTDGMESLLSPLNKLHFPVHDLSMMMSIALRFIPTLIEETDKIMSAQKARGANFETGKLTERAKALIPLLVPLFVSAFRRADELAIAMECRCYHGGEGRTRMKRLVFARRDVLGAIIGAAIAVVMILLRVKGL